MELLVYSRCAIVLGLFSIVNSQGIIKVDPHHGNDESCSRGNNPQYPCKSLDHAFSLNDNFTSYILSNDTVHHLYKDSVFSNLRNFAIRGSNSTVLCGPDVGLSFTMVTNLVFDGVTFLYCSAVRNSTSKFYNSTNLYQFYLYPFKVGIYFYLCDTVFISDVIVSSSPEATGMVMYDTEGAIDIRTSVFSNNSVGNSEVGGGGLYIEFSYCKPGDIQCTDNTPYLNITEATYNISNCTFSNNLANNHDGFSNATYIVPFESNHQAFGRGGGLSIFVKGLSSKNRFLVTNSLFENNTAQWGGGGFVEFHDEADHNHVVFEDCKFIENKCNYTLTQGTGGGGMRIGHYVYGFGENLGTRHGNKVELRGCNFIRNSAMYGGGLSVSPTLQNTGKKNFVPAVVNLKDVLFEENVGKIGAAVHLEKFALLTEGLMINVTMQDCIFTLNTVAYAEFLESHSYPHPVGVGIIYINEVPTSFKGRNEFINNDGTALAVVGTYVNLSDSNNHFAFNKGYRGGAISLLGSAYFIINKITEVTFESNSAHDLGGAIYNRYVEMDNLKTRTNCFVRHTDPFIGPNSWNATFRFINNSDQTGNHTNSIHTSSILPCFWAGGDGYSVSKDVIFCWKNWIHCEDNVCENDNFNCSDFISSDPGSVSNSSVIEAIPGWSFPLNLDIRDDYQADVKQTVVFRATQINGSDSADSYFLGNQGTIRGSGQSDSNLILEIVGDRVWEVDLMVKLLPCPPGFFLSIDKCVCKDSQSFGGKVHCNIDSRLARLKEQHWMGMLNGNLLVGFCPLGYCQTSNTSYNNLPHTQQNDGLTATVCSDNRRGVLCGECKNGSGPVINSNTFDCINCTNDDIVPNIFKYVALVYVPLTLFFIGLIVFDIRLTTGPVNGFIVFCQVITSTFDLQANGAIPLHIKVHRVQTLRRIYMLVYGVFNLEFFENLVAKLCISPNFNTLTVLSLDYGVAIFPLVITLLILVCIRLNTILCSWCSCKKVSRLLRKLCIWRTRPLSESFLPAFAAFILLSYTKFTLTSSYILERQELVDEEGSGQSYQVYYAGQYEASNQTYQYAYFAPSVGIFVLVCLTPIILLVYPLKLIEWCIFKFHCLRILYPVDKVHFFLDTFQGCYKNNMRYFAGLYFLFRLTINSAYIATYSWPTQFIIQQLACVVMIALISLCQPYNQENKIFNYVDTLIFTNLLVLNSLTFYLYTTSSLGSENGSTVLVFAIQYILIFLPLLYMLSYLSWYFLQRCRCMRKKLKKIRQILDEKFRGVPIQNVGNTTATERATLLDKDDELFERAEVTNQYRQPGSKEISVQEISINATNNLRNSSSTRTSEMSGMSLAKSTGHYGGTGTSVSVKSTTN